MSSPALASFESASRQARDRRVSVAVRELLAEQGIGMSMDTLARRVGCSKQTLYTHYGCKHALIKRVMHEPLDTLQATLAPLSVSPDLRGDLLAFALQHLHDLNRPEVLQTCRLASTAAHNFPATGPTLWRHGPADLVEQLASRLADAVAAGKLRHDDPHFMAELLLSMIVGLDMERRHFNAPHRVHTDDIRRWAQFAVNAFICAFALPSPSSCVNKKKRSTPR